MGRTARILVIETENELALDIQKRLQTLGYEVPLTVSDGAAALEAARSLCPEVIVVNAGLRSQLNGLAESSTPVVFLAASTHDGSLHGGSAIVVQEPFRETDLRNAIQLALHHSAAGRQQQREHWLAATLRSIGDPVVALDTDRRVRFLNPAAEALIGWTGPEAWGRPLPDVFRLADHGSPLISREGDSLPVEFQENPIFNEDGSLSGSVLVFRKSGNRERKPEVNCASEEQLRTLANSMAQLAWMGEPNGDILWYNERWYEYTGTTLEEMKGWGWKKVHDPLMLPAVIERWRESLSTGTAFDMEFPLRRADGVFRWFLTRVIPVRNSHGEIERWFGTNTDIHEAREAREQLRRANDSLAQFAYSASHDLQEPLRNVAIYSQLMSRRYAGLLDEQGMLFLGYITEGATRMEALVKDLLAYAESGTSDDDHMPLIEADAVLREVISNLRPVINETAAEITFDALPRLPVRPVHLRQLFQNLLGNALKYRNPGTEPRIHVAARPGGGEWIFLVRDNGIGVDPAYHGRIFGLFKRLHTAREYSGTGLGLALCKNIVGLYGGRIWLESDLGFGSTFYFTLPRAAGYNSNCPP